MPFTLSAAQTIDGIANSYKVTGNGNLDDLASACSGVGMSRTNNVITFAPGVNRIIAICGTLTEDRDGLRQVLIRSGGHICWGFENTAGFQGIVTLGKLDSTTGVYRGRVDIVWESTALAVGADVFNAWGRCAIGAGTFTGVCGSFSYNHASRSDFDIADSVVSASFDNFQVFMTSAAAAYTHAWKPTQITTTDRTCFVFVQRPMEGPAASRTVTPFFTDVGFRWLAPVGGTTLRVLRPTYSSVDCTNGGTNAVIDVIDPASRWIGSSPFESFYLTHTGIKRVFRTIWCRLTTSAGDPIPDTTTKLVVLTPQGTTTVVSAVSGLASYEALQSTRANGVNHNTSGLGYTDEGTYSFWAVAYGFAAQNLNINVGTAYQGTAGIPWSPRSSRNALAASVAYASVVTAPFSFSEAGSGTLTISSNCSIDQIGQYLLKIAYDNAASSYWRNLNHSPVSLVAEVADFGNINFVINNGVVISEGTLAKKIKTNGIVTAAGAISNLSIIGNVTQNTPTDLTGVTITGTLTYNTNVAATVSYTNTTVGMVVNNGTGIITINRTNSSIGNYTDAEINFIDSTISVIGADTVTIHPTANDRNLNQNISASFSGSYAFKFGALINGSTMSGTLYLRCVSGGIPFNIDKSIVLGDNTVDLGVTAQLASLNGKIELTAKQASLQVLNDGIKKASLLIPHTMDV